jgi:hypothetical protein
MTSRLFDCVFREFLAAIPPPPDTPSRETAPWRWYNSAMSPRDMQITFIAEIIEIYRSIQQRCEGVASFLGAESIDYFDDEIERLRKVVLNLSGATARRNKYHDQLVELGAAEVDWGYLARVREMIYTDDLKPCDLAKWLLDYADGTVFGLTVDALPAESEIDERGIRLPSNEEMVQKHGLLPPRTNDEW